MIVFLMNSLRAAGDVFQYLVCPLKFVYKKTNYKFLKLRSSSYVMLKSEPSNRSVKRILPNFLILTTNSS